RKLRVSATQSVSAKKARRRSANLMPFLLVLSSSVRSHPASRSRLRLGGLAGGEPLPPRQPGTIRPSGSLLLRGQMHHHLRPVWVVVGRRLRERVGRSGPAAEGAGAVLEPVDGLRDGNDRNLLEHDELELGDNLLLRRGIGRLRELYDQLVGGRVLVPFEVRTGRRADRRRVRRVQPLPELEV